MPAEIYFNVAISGLLTGLVYGLMALGLSVIFGVVRVVNFAHGEMMTIAMYLAVVLFASFKLDPLLMMLPIAAVLFALGYSLQNWLITPFINRPEHAQFMLLIAVAIILVNGLLIVFGPDAQNVQTAYSFDSFALGPRRPARRSALAPTITTARWWSGLTCASSMRSPSGLAPPASAPPAPSWC